MEQALVYVIPSSSAKGNLQIAYTERRFSEANRMISDQASVQGLAYLDTQVNTTKNAILTTSDPVVKKQLAQKYIATLQTVNTQLEAQKQIAQAAVPSTATVRATPTALPTPTPRTYPTGKPYTPTPTPTPTPMPTQENPPPTTIVTSIENTQENIGSTIQEIEKLSGPEHKENSNNPGNLQNNKDKNDISGSNNGDNKGKGKSDRGNGNDH